MPQSFGLPRQCVSVIAQTTERLMPVYRDAVGVLDTERLTLGVMGAGDLIVESGATVTLKGMVSGAVHRSRARGLCFSHPSSRGA